MYIAPKAKPTPVRLGWIKVVREPLSSYERTANHVIQSSDDVANFCRPRINAELCEVMYVLFLDGRNNLRGIHEVARGGLHGCSVSARDILRPAVASGASAIVLVHNHPSGDPTPSAEDVAMTRSVVAAANVIGVPVVDHVIIAGERHSSLAGLGLGGL